LFGHVGLGVNTTDTVGLYPVENASIRELVRGQSVPGRVIADKTMSQLTARETFRIKTSAKQDRCIQAFIDEGLKIHSHIGWVAARVASRLERVWRRRDAVEIRARVGTE
jgi:hypothetical protein